MLCMSFAASMLGGAGLLSLFSSALLRSAASARMSAPTAVRAAYHVGLDQLRQQQMCPLLQEQVRLLGWVVIGQVAGENWLEI